MDAFDGVFVHYKRKEGAMPLAFKGFMWGKDGETLLTVQKLFNRDAYGQYDAQAHGVDLLTIWMKNH